MLADFFNFELPEACIAQDPISPRDHCKLLVYDSKNDTIHHKKFFEIRDYLSNNDVFVLNKSKVIPARIRFAHMNKKVEVFILRRLKKFLYEVMVKPVKLFANGRRILIDEDKHLDVLDVYDNGLRLVRSNLDLEKIGELPLPPYIKSSRSEFEDYQTVFASKKGSVAAPTAGLHFTKSLIINLKNSGIEFEKVLLHVGLGTFSPVKTEKVEDHFMHKEYYELDLETAERLNMAIKSKKRLIAVGTTSVRVLESCFNAFFKPSFGETDIFIYPGNYKWKVVDGLITNFHLPKSTLLMLVASFLEHKKVSKPIEKLLSLYKIAVQNNYRFYSFGDAMFIH